MTMMMKILKMEMKKMATMMKIKKRRMMFMIMKVIKMIMVHGNSSCLAKVD